MDRKYLSPYNQRDQKLNYLTEQRIIPNKERDGFFPHKEKILY